MATKKVTVTIPEDLVEKIRKDVGDRGISAYVTMALRGQLKRDGWRELLDWLEQEHGALTEAEIEEARTELAADQEEIRKRREQAASEPSPSCGSIAA